MEAGEETSTGFWGLDVAFSGRAAVAAAVVAWGLWARVSRKSPD